MSERVEAIELLEKMKEVGMTDEKILEYLVVHYFDSYTILEALKSAAEEFGVEGEEYEEFENEEDGW